MPDISTLKFYTILDEHGTEIGAFLKYGDVFPGKPLLGCKAQDVSLEEAFKHLDTIAKDVSVYLTKSDTLRSVRDLGDLSIIRKCLTRLAKPRG